jgi:serine protease
MTAVRYAAGLANATGKLPATHADIINLSLGGSESSSEEQALYRQVTDSGIIVVAAAGNSASSAPSYPAAYDGVVSVSAVTLDGTLAPYSNFGPTIDVAAPGGDTSKDLNGDGYGDGVLSTVGDVDASGSIQMVYKFYQGTSMATPHVAGVAALMKSLYPALTASQFQTLLASGLITRDLGATGRDDQYGYGLIDALKAVQEAQQLAGNNGSLPATLVVTPGSLNFGFSLQALTLSAQNGGDEDLQVTDVSDDAAWLSLSPDNVTHGLGTYSAVVNRSGLDTGTYTATISFQSTANQVTVPVIMQVLSSAAAGDTGFQYILLVDPQTLTRVAQVTVGSDGTGAYPFKFTDVPSGTYRVYAGSDPNDDGFICDAGEACGAYATLDQPTALNVTKDLTGIDFGTDFNINLPSSASTAGKTIPPLSRIPLKQVKP